MNIKEYIESGVVAAYVLGLASEDEQREFESLCKQYPELSESKRSFELALEEQLMKEAVPLPEGLKGKVLGSLQKTGTDTIPASEKVYEAPVRKMNAWKMLSAACILVILAGSFYFVYFFKVKYQELQKENIALKNNFKKSSYTNPVITIDTIVKNPSVKWSAMIEPTDSSHCMAHVYWDTLSAKTYLLVGNIPPPVNNKQFQLWALRNNHAINLGMFDIRSQGKVIQMKNVEKAKTFVITIEQQAGSSVPSMEAVYAVGKL